MAAPGQYREDKQVCYAEQDSNESKGHVPHSDAPEAVPQQQQQSVPAPMSSAWPTYQTEAHPWPSSSPPPPSVSYVATSHGPGSVPIGIPRTPGRPYGADSTDAGDHDREGIRILGLRPATFFLSVALVVVIIVGAVGGGVGGSIAVQNARNAAAVADSASAASAASTVTVTATVSVADSSAPTMSAQTASTKTTSASASQTSNSKIPIPPSDGVIDFDCSTMPQKALDIQLGQKKWSFDPKCGVDLIGSGIDILGIIMYNPQQCAQACASYNNNLGRNDCVAVSFQADLGVAVPNFGNCFLKNSTGTDQVKTNLQVSFKLKQ